MRNWPEGVPFPPIFDNKTYRALKKTKVDDKKLAKSVQNLSRDHLHFLYDAITHSKTPLTFEVYAGDNLEGEPPCALLHLGD